MKVTQNRLKMASNLLGSIAALNTAAAGDSEEEQRKAFESNKKLGIASAIINTASAVIGAISPAAGGLGIPAGLPGAAAATATGAAQLLTISKQTFDSGVQEPEDAEDPVPIAEEAIATPQVDLGFLGQGSGSTLQAYVIAENVTNQQQANQIITDQTVL